MIIVYIPSKGISESIPKKNMVSYFGLPLFIHSILIAKKSKARGKIEYIDFREKYIKD